MEKVNERERQKEAETGKKKDTRTEAQKAYDKVQEKRVCSPPRINAHPRSVASKK